jgi:hypothetical protein
MNIRVILVADGETDYDIMDKVKAEDGDLSSLPLEFLRPEAVGLHRRTGGGHKTLLKEAGLAAIMAAKGHADCVMVLVDNDGDSRFSFPHDNGCPGCRECDARDALERVNWGLPFQRTASIVFQAAETLLLSARSGFTPQMETELVGKRLKTRLYGRDIQEARELYDAFRTELEQTSVQAIRARCYPRIKGKLKAFCPED